jgi:diaminopimelate epimerase
VPLPLGHTVHRAGRLDLLPGSDGISLFQELGERHSRAFSNGVLKLLRQISERDVRMDRLHIAQKLIGQPPRGGLQRGDTIEDRGEDDRLHDLVCGSRHVLSYRWTSFRPLPKSRRMRRHFHKMHGLGNDFVIVDARETPFDVTTTLARAIADRRTGVGCDQLIVLLPSSTADLRMRIWNRDGGEVESCGNATRCVVQLTGAVRIESDGGPIEGQNLGDEIEVTLGQPRFGWNEIPLAYPMDTSALPMAWDELQHPMALNVGNPHLVFFVPNAREVRLDELGPTIENDPAFPERINVNVATCADNRLQLRTFERGAGETLACGTGACASAIAAIASRRSKSPVSVGMTGGTLTVSWSPGEPVRMRGAATHVFDGELDLEALS